MTNEFRSGFIAIVGRPNVGKSTFMNHVIGEKIAITSDKPQTTRNKIQGVLTEDDTQMVFIDTPGIHKPKHQLGDYMVKVAQNTFNEVDLILFMVNAYEGYGRGDQFIIDRLETINTPVFLVINKIDLMHPNDLLPLIDLYKDKLDFQEIVPISALKNDDVAHLLNVLKQYLPQGPKYYPDDMLTDHPEQFIISELIREKVLQLTEEEIPHSIAVFLEQMEKRRNDTVYIQAVIVTERPSQKGILIGKRGRMLKKVGQKARRDIEHLLGSHVYLDLWVKVQKGWRNKQMLLRELGFNNEES
ncbi:MAG TPA: GTPase Era [Bacillota bacterium]|nr:GTPase Era [Bacillota bacterium]